MNFDNVSVLGENNSYVVDLSGSGNDGNCSGATCPFLDASGGKYFGGYEFDGTGAKHIWVEHSTTLDFNSSTNFSGSLWFRLTSDCQSPDYDNNVVFISKFGADYSDGGWWLGCNGETSNNPQELRFEISDGENINITSGETINDKKWHHAGFTYNSTSMEVKLFLDGVEVNSRVTSTNFNLSYVNPVCIGTFGNTCNGKDDNGQAFEMNGSLDEVRLFNRTLSGKEMGIFYMSNLRKYDTDKWEFYINQTKNATAGLDEGEYTYQAFAKDEAGNINSTEERTINVGKAPEIGFRGQTLPNASTIENNYYEANVSINESNLDEFVWNWNGTNYTAMNDSLLLSYNFDNVSSLGENNSYVVDMSGNGNNASFTPLLSSDIGYIP